MATSLDEASKFMEDMRQMFTHLREQDVIGDECETWWKANYAAPKKKMRGRSKSKSKRATSAIPEMPPLFSADDDQDNSNDKGEV